jgi:hypothetical protein
MTVKLHRWRRFPLRRLAVWRDNLDIWSDFRDLKGWHCRKCGSYLIASRPPGRVGGSLHTFYALRDGLTPGEVRNRKWFRNFKRGRRFVGDVRLDCNLTMVRRMMKR